jgi:hypothetical protein
MRSLTVDGIKARYKLEYTQTKTMQDWLKLARKVDSTQPDGEKYAGAQGVYGPSEKKGEDIAYTIASESFIIRNRRWDGGLRVPGIDWRWNKTDDTNFKIKQLAQLMSIHPGSLMETLFTAGKSTLCSEGGGIYYFSASHVVGATTQSNLLSTGYFDIAVATAPTSAEWAKCLLYMATQMMLFKDTQGNFVNMGVTDFSVLVPAGLFPSLIVALNQQMIATSESNPLKGNSKFSFNPILLPNWTETDEFIMAANGQSALVYQELEAPDQLIVLGPGTEYYQEKDEVKAIARGAYNCGFDRWQGACYATFS